MPMVLAESKRRHQLRSAKSVCLRLNNSLADSSVSILLALVCCLLVADIKCDKIGSTNVSGSTESNAINSLTSGISSGSSKSISSSSSLSDTDDDDGGDGGLLVDQNLGQEKKDQTNKKDGSADSHSSINAAISKMDPLAMLREIYLDHNSKTITLVTPGEGVSQDETAEPTNSLANQLKRSVQKFHPNGRYGRRSVENFAAEPHAELGKLVFKANARGIPLSSILHLLNREHKAPAASTNRQFDLDVINKDLQRNNEARHRSGEGLFYSNGAQVANYELEMSKLLKCNYTGLTNLYWCESSNSASTVSK